MVMTRMRRRILTLGAAAGLLLAPLAAVSTAEAKPNPPGKPITVMTRNLYLGGNINRPIVAALTAAGDARSHPFTILTALANATHVTREIVDETDFKVRAGAARGRDRRRRPQPDRAAGSGAVAVRPTRARPRSASSTPPGHATTTSWRSCSTDLAARGANYRAVSIADRADVESPSFTGSIAAPGGSPRDVRLTMRDVILMRVSSDLHVTGEGQKIYEENLELGMPGIPGRVVRRSTAATSGSTCAPARAVPVRQHATSRRSAPPSRWRRRRSW